MQQSEGIWWEEFPAMSAVCSRCINERSLAKHIEKNASDYQCSYCGESWEKPRAMDLDELLRHMHERIEMEYEDAANSVGYESREGGYLLPTMDGYELLSEAAPDWDPGSERLRDDLAAEFMDTQWVHKNPYSPTEEEVWIWSWADFVRLVKHRVRFLLFPPEMQVREEFSETTAPSEMLERLGNLFLDTNLFCTLEAGTKMFRVRIREPGHPRLSTIAELGPPPIDKARFANRMSPAGVSMFYAAFGEDTALAETDVRTVCGPAEASIAVFRTTRDLNLLDLVDLPDVPSIFDDDSANLDRASVSFLHAFNLDFTRSVEKDGHEHVEYVPSQVVTEFVRYRLPAKADTAVHGIRYRSSRRDGGIGCVLFFAHEDIVDRGYGPAVAPPFELVSVRTRTLPVNTERDR